MPRYIRPRFSTLMFTTLVMLLFAGPALGQDGGDPWTQVQKRLRVEFPKQGFYPNGRSAFGSMPHNLIGQFFYGDEDGRVSLTLPLWVDKPNKGEDWNAVVRSGEITKEYSEYPVVFSLYRLRPDQTAREEIEKEANRYGYMTNPDREWKEDVIRNNQLHYRDTLTGPFAWQRDDVTYHECPGYRIKLYAKWDVFELQGVFKNRTNSLYDIHQKVRRPTTMQTFAGFEFTVSEDERYCILCEVTQRNNIHREIPYASGSTIDYMLTTIAETLADVFGKEAVLDRELSEEEYSRVKQQWSDLAARAPEHFLVSEFRKGYVGIAIAAMGDVVHDPGRGKPKKMVKGTKVRIGDWIRTGPNGRVRIEMFDRDEPNNAGPSVVNIATDSELFIGSFLYSFDDTGKQKSMVELIRGTIREIFTGWGPSRVFSVKAGVAICGIRGSDVVITHDPNSKMVNAYVIEGHMDIRDSRSGDVRLLTANQQLTVSNGTLGEVTPMSREDWDGLVRRNGLNAGGSGVAQGSGAAEVDIPSLTANVRSLRFFEKGKDFLPVDQRVYRQQFSSSDTRYISWDLYLTYPKQERRNDFVVEAVWYCSDGSEYARMTQDCYQPKGWAESLHNSGWGSEIKGTWAPGRYRCDLFIEGQKIASGSIEVTGESHQAAYDIPSLVADVKSLRFFEKGGDFLPVDQRVYRQQFSSSETRYIAWEIYLAYPKQERRNDFVVEAVWYRSDGSEYARMTQNCYQPKGWAGSLHESGWGSETKGTWAPGRYRCDLFIEGQKIASGSIEVTGRSQ